METHIKIGNSFELIKTEPDKKFDCVVTSPPYWGLRDYDTPPVIFDAMDGCEHEWVSHTQKSKGGMPTESTTVGANKNGAANNRGHDTITDFCSKCGAWRGQLGLEPTPELFLKHLWQLFDDIKLKLKDTGTCWVNLGDTYNGTKNGNTDLKNKAVNTNVFTKHRTNLPDKCLCMIPERFAWGMIERGWILRNKPIWAKPNHMPESVTDRLTKSYEHVYFFTKNGKYDFNLDAVREPHKAIPKEIKRCKKIDNPNNKNTILTGNQAYSGGIGYSDKGKNPGDVWQINTQPYPEAHFAVFPLELVRIPILAGCPEGGHVLDPFGGSGTVAEFCLKNNRECTIYELNENYKSFIVKKTYNDFKKLDKWV